MYQHLASTLTIWLQPPFFSICEKQWGHSFVYFPRYWLVATSFSHSFINLQGIGSCGSLPQWKQKLVPHTQVQFWRYSKWYALMAKLQPGDGHQRNEWLCWNLSKKLKSLHHNCASESHNAKLLPEQNGWSSNIDIFVERFHQRLIQLLWHHQRWFHILALDSKSIRHNHRLQSWLSNIYTNNLYNIHDYSPNQRYPMQKNRIIS